MSRTLALLLVWHLPVYLVLPFTCERTLAYFQPSPSHRYGLTIPFDGGRLLVRAPRQFRLGQAAPVHLRVLTPPGLAMTPVVTATRPSQLRVQPQANEADGVWEWSVTAGNAGASALDVAFGQPLLESSLRNRPGQSVAFPQRGVELRPDRVLLQVTVLTRHGQTTRQRNMAWVLGLVLAATWSAWLLGRPDRGSAIDRQA